MGLPSKRVFGGPRAGIYVGNTKIGYARNIAGSVTYARENVFALGDARLKERPLLNMTVTCTIGRFAIVQESLYSLGLLPYGTTLELVNFPELDIRLLDKVGGGGYCRIHRATPDSFDFDLSVGTVIGENTNWGAVDFKPDFDV